MLGPSVFCVREDEHLDLVELVHAEHASRVLAGGAGLAAEAGREPGIAERQRVAVEDLGHVHRRKSHLGGAREEEAVLLELVDVRLLGWEESGAEHCLLAYEDGREDGREAGGSNVVKRKSVEGEGEQRRIADEIAEARSREPGSPFEFESTDLACLLRIRRRGRIADAAELHGVILGIAVGRGRMRRIWHLSQGCVACGFGGGQVVFGRPELLLQELQRPELLGRRFALELRSAPQIVDAWHELAPALVGCEECVERLCGALSRECGAPCLGIGSSRFEVDHAMDSR